METKTLFQNLKRHGILDDVRPFWPEVAPLLQPVPEGHAESVLSHDSFADIKMEIDKVTAIQTDKIITGSAYLCQNVGKDVRVAIYHTYALLQKEGYEGLIKGLLLLYGMLLLYEHDYQPRRLRTLEALLSWLRGDKMENALLLRIEPVGELNLSLITGLLALIEEVVEAQYEQKTEALKGFLRLLPNTGVPTQVGPEPERVKPAALSLAEDVDITSTQALMDTIKKVVAYLNQDPATQMAALRVARAVRWDSLSQLPLHHDGQTQIVPPRQELVSKLESALRRQAWPEVLDISSAAFLEAANHFWLDLQYGQWLALTHLGGQWQVWADIGVADMAYFKLRLPDIAQLSFQGGMAFAHADTQHWLHTQANVQDYAELDSVLVSDGEEGPNQRDFMALKEYVLNIQQEQGFAAALRWMDELKHEDSGVKVLQRKYLVAQLAEADGKWAMALSLLEALNQALAVPPLLHWDTHFSFNVSADLWRLLQRQLNNKHLDKQQVQAQISALEKQLVNLNPGRAYQLMA
ncbi:MAG: type VI secretion system domain-containing protein [Neisseriaceae bacterium]|nr:type VI secretion system domain-containing protein [Neisseriaceae bacterium]